MNTLTPVVTFVCLLLFERWLRWASLAYAIAAAVSLYVLVFFEPVPLVIGGLIALVLARALVRGEIGLKTLTRQSGFVIAGVLRHVRAGLAAVRLQPCRCVPPRFG